jgi:5-methylcytosine-specific restriction endonuclease McrA
MPTAPPAHRPPGYVKRDAWQRAPNAKPKPLGRAWRAMRLRVFRRDGYRCRVCGRLCARPECDHIVARANGGSDNESNLQTLCHDCHEKKTIRESHAAMATGDGKARGEL